MAIDPGSTFSQAVSVREDEETIVVEDSPVVLIQRPNGEMNLIQAVSKH